MPLKELLLNSSSFTEMLKQYAVNPVDFIVKDETLILSEIKVSKEEVFKETVLIEGHNSAGYITFIGTLYCNLKKNIAVFELDTVEKGKAGLIGA